MPVMWKSDLEIRREEKIQLRTPDGNILDTYIGSIERAYGTSGVRLTIGLPANITKQDVPEGTEIWLVAQQAP